MSSPPDSTKHSGRPNPPTNPAAKLNQITDNVVSNHTVGPGRFQIEESPRTGPYSNSREALRCLCVWMDPSLEKFSSQMQMILSNEPGIIKALISASHKQQRTAKKRPTSSPGAEVVNCHHF